jgi:hypothetical protein
MYSFALTDKNFEAYWNKTYALLIMASPKIPLPVILYLWPRHFLKSKSKNKILQREYYIREWRRKALIQNKTKLFNNRGGRKAY